MNEKSDVKYFLWMLILTSICVSVSVATLLFMFSRLLPGWISLMYEATVAAAVSSAVTVAIVYAPNELRERWRK